MDFDPDFTVQLTASGTGPSACPRRVSVRAMLLSGCEHPLEA